jgi:hypothetical protein
MKIKYFIFAFLISIACFAQSQDKSGKDFYYYKGEKHYLDIDYSRISIATKGQISQDAILESVNKSLKIEREGRSQTANSLVLEVGAEIKDLYLLEAVFSETLEKDAYNNIIKQLEKEDYVIKASPAYISHGKDVGVSNNIYVKLFDKEDVKFLIEFAEKNSMQVLGHSKYTPLWYTLTCTKASSLNAFKAAQKFYETKKIAAAEPELLYHNLLSTNDPYFSDQWGLKNTGQNGGTSGIDIKPRVHGISRLAVQAPKSLFTIKDLK